MKNIFILIFVIACFGNASAQWSLIESEYDTEDLGVATFTDASIASIDKTGKEDSQAGIQELLNRLGNAGGGVLYLAAGKYKITGKLLIPKGVILRGDWKKPVKGRAVGGTILMAYFGRGTETEDNAFITTESSTGIYNLSIWYPEQDADNIVAYPPAVLYGKQGYWGNDYNNVRNVTLVNVYSGVVLSQRNGGGCPNVFNLYGTALSRGIEIDNIADVGRLDGIVLSPDFWAGSGLPGAPAKDGPHAAWMRRNGTGIVMRRNDWSYTCNADIEGYKYGFIAAESVASAGAAPNGHNYGLTFRNCGTGIRIEKISNAGMMFTHVGIENCEEGIVVAEGAASTLQLLDCEITAAEVAVRMENGASTKVMTQQCKIVAGKVILGGGLFCAVDGDFENAAPQITVGPFARTILTGNRFALTPNIRNNSLFECKIDHNESNGKRLPAFTEIRPRVTRPARSALYVVTNAEFGAVADAITDNTVAIQKALDRAGSEGGGVVYLPAGKYKVAGNLNIPTGVELKGASDLASVPKGQGSIIEIYAGKNQPDGTPFLQLSGKSGLRGLTFDYPEQISTMTVNPATLPKYPYCIRATGDSVYIVNVGVRATYNGIDLFSYKCDNHYVDYFAGHVFKNAIRVGGGSEKGLISNAQFNSLVYANGFENPKFGNWPNSINTTEAKNAVYNQNWLELEFMIFEDCKDEVMYDNFHYASHKGLTFREGNGKSPSGVSIGTGIDASMRAICFEALSGERDFNLINSQVVSVARDEVYADTHFLETATGFKGTANLFGSDYWGNAKYGGIFNGSGKVNLALAHFEQYGASQFLNIKGGDEILLSGTDCNASSFVSSGKGGQVSVESSVLALASPTGYKRWFDNLTTNPVFVPDATLARNGWIATASGGNPSLAIDGNASTRWDNGSQVNPGQWFAVDTRTPVRINTVILDASGSPNDFPNVYAVYVSNDGVNWGQPVATGSQRSAVVIIQIPDTTTRCVKVVQTGSGKTQYWSIHEFYLAYVDDGSNANAPITDDGIPCLYPNPVSDGLIHIRNAENVKSVKVYGLDGRIINYESGITNYVNGSMDVSRLPKGVYIFRIETVKGVSGQKIVIR